MITMVLSGLRSYEYMNMKKILGRNPDSLKSMGVLLLALMRLAFIFWF